SFAAGHDVTVQSTTTVNTGQWVHVAAVRIEATGVIEVFVNGNLEASVNTLNTGPLSDPANITIGGNVVDRRFFKGEIDDVRIYNVARTAADIQGDMYQTLTGTEPGLVGYWQFDEGAGTTSADKTASHNTAFLGAGNAPNIPGWNIPSTAPLQATPP